MPEQSRRRATGAPRWLADDPPPKPVRDPLTRRRIVRGRPRHRRTSGTGRADHASGGRRGGRLADGALQPRGRQGRTDRPHGRRHRGRRGRGLEARHRRLGGQDAGRDPTQPCDVGGSSRFRRRLHRGRHHRAERAGQHGAPDPGPARRRLRRRRRRLRLPDALPLQHRLPADRAGQGARPRRTRLAQRRQPPGPGASLLRRRRAGPDPQRVGRGPVAGAGLVRVRPRDHPERAPAATGRQAARRRRWRRSRRPRAKARRSSS